MNYKTDYREKSGGCVGNISGCLPEGKANCLILLPHSLHTVNYTDKRGTY